MTTLQEGAVFAGRYQVVRCIAAGGMGEVYEVLHLETERRRALKVMHANVLGSDDLRERFKREAKVAAHIESEFIVDVFDAGIDEATRMPFMVMELLRGEELGKRLKRVGRFSPDEVVMYLQQTARALDKTHRASIVHRDLKPENLFLTEREEGPGTIKVLDFGIAKIVVEGQTSGATQMIGTPVYMAPEQFEPDAKITNAVDIFALGMVAYTLLVGAPYWASERRSGLYALTAVAMFGPKEPASARAAAWRVALPPAFDAWFAKATAASPEHRFARATEAVRALAEALGVAAPARATLPSISEVSDMSALLGRAASRSFGPSSSPSGTLDVGTGPPSSSRWSFTPAPGHISAPVSVPSQMAASTHPSAPVSVRSGHISAPASVPSHTAASTHPTMPGASITTTAEAPQVRKRALFGAAIGVALAVVFGVTILVLRGVREGESRTDQAGSAAAQAEPMPGSPSASPTASMSASAASTSAPVHAGAPVSGTIASAAEPAVEPAAPTASVTAPQAAGKTPPVIPYRKRYPRD